MTCLLLNQHTSSSKTDASCSSETSVSSHKTAQCHNPVDHNLNTCRCFTKCYISYHDTWLNEIEAVMDHGMVKAAARALSQNKLCGISDGKSDTGRGFI